MHKLWWTYIKLILKLNNLPKLNLRSLAIITWSKWWEWRCLRIQMPVNMNFLLPHSWFSCFIFGRFSLSLLGGLMGFFLSMCFCSRSSVSCMAGGTSILSIETWKGNRIAFTRSRSMVAACRKASAQTNGHMMPFNSKGRLKLARLALEGSYRRRKLRVVRNICVSFYHATRPTRGSGNIQFSQCSDKHGLIGRSQYSLGIPELLCSNSVIHLVSSTCGVLHSILLAWPWHMLHHH